MTVLQTTTASETLDAPAAPAVKRVLFVAYAFPPVGGAGVQRTTKFVKYLRHAGWNASVLTVNEASVPVLDHSLAPDVPQDTIVRRARTLEPSYRVKESVAKPAKPGLKATALGALRRAGRTLLQPDPQVLWAPDAIREGMRLLASVPHDAVVATGPPFSCFLIGSILARRAKLPLILDYRDEWDLSNLHYENRQPGRVVTALQQAMQRWALRAATAVLATTERSAQALRTRARGAGSPAEVSWIYNGYDPADFAFQDAEAGEAAAPAPRKFRLVYTGTLWNLMSVEPVLQALTKLNARRPDLVASLEFVFAGRCLPEQQVFIDRLRELPCTVVQHDYMDHSRAVRLMCSADALCLLLADKEGAARWVPGKTFEYMATGRSILAVIPPGEIRELLANHPGAAIMSPDDLPRIEEWLEREIGWFVGGISSYRGVRGWCPHNRQVQASQLASLLDSISGHGERRWSPGVDDRIVEVGGVSFV